MLLDTPSGCDVRRGWRSPKRWFPVLPLAALLVASSGLSGASAARAAGVRAYDAATGAEDQAFVRVGSVGRVGALIPDGRRGSSPSAASGRTRAVVRSSTCCPTAPSI